MLRSVRVGTIVDLETGDCRLRVLLVDGTSREETTGDSCRDFLRWTRDSRPREILVDETTAKKSGEDESQSRATGDEGRTTSVHSKVGQMT